MLIGEGRILETLHRTLAETPGDAKEALFVGNEQGLTRYAESSVHQHMHIRRTDVSFRVAVGKRIGTASTSSLDVESLRHAARAAFEMAGHQPEIPHFEGFPKLSPVRKIKTHFGPTAKMNPRSRAKVMKAVFERARKDGVRVAGAFSTSEGELAVVNSNGLARYQPLTAASVTIFALTDDSSGYADGFSRDVRDLDVPALAERAVGKALLGRNPVALEPGQYDVVLEPTAVSEIMEWLCFTAFSPKAYDDGMSFMEGREGKSVMGENVAIYDDGLEREGLPAPFDFEGSPKKKVHLVKSGKAKGIVYDSLYGAKSGKGTTGHALPPGSPERAMPVNLFMEAGEATEDEMRAALGRGIWVTKFHYLNGYLDPKRALMTGMTRDGAFHVEDGKLRRGIVNMRFTQGMLEAFSKVAMISKERRAVKTWWSGIGANTVPTLLIKDFTFTGRQEKTPAPVASPTGTGQAHGASVGG